MVVRVLTVTEKINKYRLTQKTETFEMRGASHVQLAALRNRDLELQKTSPFSNHRSVERSTACFRHKKGFTVKIFQSSIFVGYFLKFPYESL
jgi:hypothetical protein